MCLSNEGLSGGKGLAFAVLGGGGTAVSCFGGGAGGFRGSHNNRDRVSPKRITLPVMASSSHRGRRGSTGWGRMIGGRIGVPAGVRGAGGMGVAEELVSDGVVPSAIPARTAATSADVW